MVMVASSTLLKFTHILEQLTILPISLLLGLPPATVGKTFNVKIGYNKMYKNCTAILYRIV